LKIAAVILAAGASRRLGEPKQMVVFGGERLLDRAVRIADEAGCEPVIVVLGAWAEDIQANCRLDGAKIVRNEAWEEGMASSVRIGVQAAPAHVEGLVLMTCDQPAVSAEYLRRLIGGGETVGSLYQQRVGVPAFFPASQWGGLLGLRGDEGARKLLQVAAAIELPGGELDIDTVESLAAARQRWE